MARLRSLLLSSLFLLFFFGFIAPTEASAYTLDGKVLGGNATPLSNQTVRLRAGSTTLTTTTDANGNYSFTANAGTYTIELAYSGTPLANAPHWYTLSIPGYVLSGNTTQDIQLPVKKVSIHVEDASHSAQSNVLFKTNNVNPSNLTVAGVTNASGTSRYAGNSAAYTDANGDVDLWLFVPPTNNPYVFTAIPPSGNPYAITTLTNFLFTTDTSTTLTLLSPVTMSGEILGGDATPLPNQVLRVHASNNSAYFAETTTDANGEYTINLAPGTYYMVLSYGNGALLPKAPYWYELQIPTYTVSGNTTQDFQLPLNRVNVHVKDMLGNNVSNAYVKTNFVAGNNLSVAGVTNAVGNSRYGFGNSGIQTDASGNAEMWLFKNNTPSPYTLTVTPPTGSPYQTTAKPNVNVNGTTQVEITMQQPTVTLSGYVKGGSSSALPNQKVTIQSGSYDVVTATTNTNGFYSVNVPSGTYNILVSYNSSETQTYLANAPYWYELTVPGYSLSQNTTQDIDLPLKKVSVHVEDASHSAQANTFVKNNFVTGNNLNVAGVTNAYGDSRYGFGNAGAETDANGNVDLWLFAPNTTNPYVFNAIPPSGSPYSVGTLANVLFTTDTSKTITLYPPVTLNGKVRGGNNTPLPNQQIEVQSSANSGIIYQTTTDVTGDYSVDLAPGTYDITLSYNSAATGTPLAAAPYWYTVTIPGYSITQNTTDDFVLPVKEVSLHVEDSLNNDVSNAHIKTNFVNPSNLVVGSITNAYGSSRYGFGDSGIATDASGDATLWVFPSSNTTYDFAVTPPTGSGLSTATLSGITITTNYSDTITLQ